MASWPSRTISRSSSPGNSSRGRTTSPLFARRGPSREPWTRSKNNRDGRTGPARQASQRLPAVFSYAPSPKFCRPFSLGRSGPLRAQIHQIWSPRPIPSVQRWRHRPRPRTSSRFGGEKSEAHLAVLDSVQTSFKSHLARSTPFLPHAHVGELKGLRGGNTPSSTGVSLVLRLSEKTKRALATHRVRAGRLAEFSKCCQRPLSHGFKFWRYSAAKLIAVSARLRGFRRSPPEAWCDDRPLKAVQLSASGRAR